jgi:hypothetical protein
MILADLLQWFLFILGALLTLNANWLAAHALLPGMVARARAQYQGRPVLTTVVGGLITVPLVLTVIIAAKQAPHPVVQMGAVGLLLLLGLLALIGSAGLAERVGLGLPAPVDGAQPWRRVLRGGIVLGLAFLMPFLGWFVVLPWTLISGVGAWALAGRAPRADANATIATVSGADRP